VYARRLQRTLFAPWIVHPWKKRNILIMRINRALGLIIMLVALKILFVDTMQAFGSASATTFRTAESVMLVAKDKADEQRR
jgi:hypothetical protein